jgi:hypothetical protein
MSIKKQTHKSSKGSPEGKIKYSSSKRRQSGTPLEPLDAASRRMADLAYWLGRMQVQQNQNESTNEVLSQPVRHELNKFFFDVTSTPTKAQRKQLWYELQMIDPSVVLRMSKITRWFQNKRQYMKKHYGQESSTVAQRRPLGTKSKTSYSGTRTIVASDSEGESDLDDEQESD